MVNYKCYNSNNNPSTKVQIQIANKLQYNKITKQKYTFDT